MVSILALGYLTAVPVKSIAAEIPMSNIYSAWIPYWDWKNGCEENKLYAGDLDSIVAFAMHFDSDYELVFPKGVVARDFAKLTFQGQNTYLSIVNDRIRKNNKSIFKDVHSLRLIFENEEMMEKHIEQIVAKAISMRFSGIEIDYENIWKDINVISMFPHFVEKLYKAAVREGLKIRIVMEPKSMSIAEMLPEGPEYVVMFYNLYGSHSGPGPKADKIFIEKLLKRVLQIKGTKTVAFATGGYAWPEKGRVRAVSESEAVALASEMNVSVKRDGNSQCLYYTYNEKNIETTVWYADAITLKYWIGIAAEKGIHNFSFWRLGNNVTLGEVLEE